MPDSYTGIAEVITAIAFLITSVLSGVAAIMARRTVAAIAVVSDKVVAVESKVEVVHAATNSMKDKLVAITADKSFAEGLKEGREEKNPPQNRPKEGTRNG